MMSLETVQLGKSRDEEPVHGMLVVGKELGQSPEGILLIQVHEQDGSDLTHPLAVAHLRVVDRVSS